MANRPDDPSTQFLEEVAAGAPHTHDPTLPTFANVQASTRRWDTVVDWRTIDPETIQGEGIPVEELRFYREKIDELLRDGAGRYVLIVGREIIAYFKDLEAAVSHAGKCFQGRSILIKKVAATAPIQTIGNVVV